MNRIMHAGDAIAILERWSVEGRAGPPLDGTRAGFAGWLAGRWSRLGDEDLPLLTGGGAVLWREGFVQRQTTD